MYRKWTPIILVALSIAVGLLIVFTTNQQYEYHGVVYQDPQPAPQISLSGSKGEFKLSDQQGKIVLLFFGYTSCPDICPSTLSDMKQVFNLLGDRADRAQVAFITVDPERDTVEKLSQYVSLFNPGFIGLSGTEDELAPIWDSYGVVREIDDTSGSQAGYLVNHTSRIYLVDPEGQLFITYGFGTPAEDISEDIDHILREYPERD